MLSLGHTSMRYFCKYWYVSVLYVLGFIGLSETSQDVELVAVAKIISAFVHVLFWTKFNLLYFTPTTGQMKDLQEL